MTSALTLEKQMHRAARDVARGPHQLTLPDRRHGVIVADPGWSFEPYSRETGMSRNYTCQSTAKITALAKDGVLFLWATAPMLPDALRVMAARGFTYKSEERP